MIALHITQTKTKLYKDPDTKTTYIEESKEVERISEKEYNRIVSDDTCKWYRRLGGSEHKTMAYTDNGYKCIQLISKSPDRKKKIIREFSIKYK